MSPRSPQSRNIYVLLVEGNESLSMLIERCFHESSRKTDIVTHLIASPESEFNHQTLISELKRKTYDCLLMDLKLPADIDGLALCKQVRNELKTPPAIVLLADQVSATLHRTAHAAGVSEVIDTAELTPTTLREVIDLTLRKKGLN